MDNSNLIGIRKMLHDMLMSCNRILMESFNDLTIKNTNPTKKQAYSYIHYSEMGRMRIAISLLDTLRGVTDDFEMYSVMDGVVDQCNDFAEHPEKLHGKIIPENYRDAYVKGCMKAILEILKTVAPENEPDDESDTFDDDIVDVRSEAEKESNIINFPIDRVSKKV